ncbi:CHROMOSOME TRANSMISSION FIDELITY FACTOR 18 [Salix koriyanagi]|uniref:CHROMOSOME TRANSMISSION FIDELITY FACTOR 18 n=1 Tax=Salix koriyanagi TaxID=2511006 RepID=A0A9Q0V059_9ROSI|nr:CHROMOSOME TRANSMISSION FIDELITY FACTOR 18 [Salix koriyanagi]
MQRDIRKWFMKAHDKGNDNASTNAEKKPPPTEPKTETPVREGQEGSGRRKTSKYFAANKQKQKGDEEVEDLPAKRKAQNDGVQSVKAPPSKKVRKVEDDEEDDDFSVPKKKNGASPSKKLKSSSGRDVNESDEDDVKNIESPLKSGGRGRGGRGVSGAPSGGRGRGSGRGGFMNFGERKDPPHKGEKEVPEGAPNCLAGLTFVISGTLDSLEREEAEDLIKRHGGRITGSVSKKTSYLLCDEDIEGRKSSKAKELGTPFLTEDGLFDKIRSSKNIKAPAREDSKVPVEKVTSLPKKSPQKADLKTHKDLAAEKYRPKVPNEMIGNQSLVTQLHNWLKNWNEQFHDAGKQGKGKKTKRFYCKKSCSIEWTTWYRENNISKRWSPKCSVFRQSR